MISVLPQRRRGGTQLKRDWRLFLRADCAQAEGVKQLAVVKRDGRRDRATALTSNP